MFSTFCVANNVINACPNIIMQVPSESCASEHEFECLLIQFNPLVVEIWLFLCRNLEVWHWPVILSSIFLPNEFVHMTKHVSREWYLEHIRPSKCCADLLFVVELVLYDIAISNTGAEWIECQSTEYVITSYWVNGIWWIGTQIAAEGHIFHWGLR